ncbi:MAG: hypothetical protein ACOYD7_01875 [Raoultibacter sp.]|jgi:hypothetical protein
MKTKTKLSFLLPLVFCLSVAMLLSGCLGVPANEEEAELTNSEYMSQVNRVFDDLNESLEDFNLAVADNDLVGMKSQAEKSFKIIEELESIEAPETVKEVHKGYVDGCKELKTALQDYVSLYSETQTATEAEPFDYNTYNERLDKIKKSYDAGIEKLEAADKKATELESEEEA